MTDNKSTHGTFLNGERMPPNERIEISEGESFTVGASSRSYRVISKARAPALNDANKASPLVVSKPSAPLPTAPHNAAEPADSSNDLDKTEARRRREAEIAAMVASLAAPSPALVASSAKELPPTRKPQSGAEDDHDGPPLPMRKKTGVSDDGDDEGFAVPHRVIRGGPVAVGAPGGPRPSLGAVKLAAPSAAFFTGRHANEVIGGEPPSVAVAAAGGSSDSAAGAASGPSHGQGSSDVGAGRTDSGTDRQHSAEEDDDAEDGAGDAEGPGEADEFAALQLPVGFGSRKAMQHAKNMKRARPGGAGEEEGGRPAVDYSAFQRRGGDDEQRDDGDGGGSDGDSDDGDEEEEEEAVGDTARRLGLPLSHEVVLGGHSKTITAVAMDPSGARLACGGADYMVRVFDFGAMDRSHRPLRELQPVEGQPIHALAFSGNGDRFAVATGHAKARVFDRDGSSLVTTVKGDPYISDPVNTKGHTGGLTACGWHPNSKDTLWTGSSDGSLRFWDLAGGKSVFGELCCGDVVKLRSTHRQRVGVTAAAMAPDGKFLIAAGDDGSLQLFNVKSPGHKYVRADGAVPGAHAPGDTTCVVLAPDGLRAATRSGADSTVKLWDVRKLSARDGPVGVVTGLDTSAPTSNVAWSPDGTLLLAGTPVHVKKGAAAAGGTSSSSSSGGATVPAGRLLAFSVVDLEAAGASGLYAGGAAAGGSGASSSSSSGGGGGAKYSASLCPGGSVVALLWHPRINQVAAGCGDGNVRLLYDPSLSVKGALISAAKAPKPRDNLGDVSVRVNPLALDVIAPNAPDLFRDERLPKKRRFIDIQRDALTDPRKQPGLQLDAPSCIAKGSKSFTQAYLAQHGVTGEWRAQDPTEALRAYAAKPGGGGDMAAAAAAGVASGVWAARAYAANAPLPVLAEKTIEQQEDEEREEVRRLLGAGK